MKSAFPASSQFTRLKPRLPQPMLIIFHYVMFILIHQEMQLLQIPAFPKNCRQTRHTLRRTTRSGIPRQKFIACHSSLPFFPHKGVREHQNQNTLTLLLMRICSATVQRCNAVTRARFAFKLKRILKRHCVVFPDFHRKKILLQEPYAKTVLQSQND